MIKDIKALKRRNDRVRQKAKLAVNFRWISEPMPWLIKARSETSFKVAFE